MISRLQLEYGVCFNCGIKDGFSLGIFFGNIVGFVYVDQDGLILGPLAVTMIGLGVTSKNVY